MRRYLLWPFFALLVAASFLSGLVLGNNDLAVANQQTGCRIFIETGHQVCGKFLQYWDSHGGLPQFGFPISDELTEVSLLDGKPYTVQYFERAEFELHPQNKPPYDVLLAQLGTFRFRDQYGSQGSPVGPPPRLTTPIPVPSPEPGKGVIRGTLGYASEVIPPLEVYAIAPDNSRYFYTTTKGNQLDFVITGVEPGTYYVVSFPLGSAKGTRAIAGYTQAAECGLRVECKDHSLIPVTVRANQTASGVQVKDYGPPPGGFPGKP